MWKTGGLGREYVTTRKGRLWTAALQVPTTLINTQLAFAERRATFLLHKTGGSKRTILKDFSFGQAGAAPAGGPITVAIATDVTDRFTGAVGTQLTPRNMASDLRGKFTPETQFHYGDAAVDLATAVGGPEDPEFVDGIIIKPDLGRPLVFDAEDAIQLGSTGSILIYIIAAVAAAQLGQPVFRWYEEEIDS